MLHNYVMKNLMKKLNKEIFLQYTLHQKLTNVVSQVPLQRPQFDGLYATIKQ